MEPKKLIVARGIAALIALCGMLLVMLPLRGAHEHDPNMYDNLQETLKRQKQTEVSLLKFHVPKGA
jgi:hypothetical protein